MARRKYRHEWEKLAALDADHMAAWGAFKGYRGPVQFAGLDPCLAGVEHDAERGCLRVFYTMASGALVQERIPLQQLPCNYGGARLYFTAPCCGARARKLALLPEGVRCARCGSITQAAKRKSPLQRLIHKADVLAGRLGCESWHAPPRARPKNMHATTFNRLSDEHARAVRAALDALRPSLARASDRGAAACLGVMMRAGL